MNSRGSRMRLLIPAAVLTLGISLQGQISTRPQTQDAAAADVSGPVMSFANVSIRRSRQSRRRDWKMTKSNTSRKFPHDVDRQLGIRLSTELSTVTSIVADHLDRPRVK